MITGVLMIAEDGYACRVFIGRSCGRAELMNSFPFLLENGGLMNSFLDSAM
jgi:hypothetical protein